MTGPGAGQRLREWDRLPDGRPVHELVLGSAPGPVLHVLTLGATLHRLEVAEGAEGGARRRDIALGHASAADKLASSSYLGCTVGRYANRIAGGRFLLDGVEVQVGAHAGGHSLHGGPDGFDRRLWEVVEQGEDHALLRLVSPDGDQGFPGRVTALVRFEVRGDRVRIEHEARTDAPTLVNLTNHAYLNLDGEGVGTVEDHVLRVAAERYLPVDASGVPTGTMEAVAGSALDLRSPTRVGDVVRRDDAQVRRAGGVDHDFVLDGAGWRVAAVLESPGSGIRAVLRTDQPGLQVYTGNAFAGHDRSRDGRPYERWAGIALEPQLHPDTPHHSDDPAWPSAVLRPGETYRSALEWELTRRDPSSVNVSTSDFTDPQPLR